MQGWLSESNKEEMCNFFILFKGLLPTNSQNAFEKLGYSFQYIANKINVIINIWKEQTNIIKCNVKQTKK